MAAANAIAPLRSDDAPEMALSDSDLNQRFHQILKLRRQTWSEHNGVKNYAEATMKPPPPCSPEECEQVLQNLPAKYLPVALAQSGFFGDLEIGKRLIEIHGPIHTELTEDGYQTRLNGEPLHYVLAEEYFRNSSSPAEIAKVMEWLPEAGMGWMVGIGSEHSVLFQSKQLEAALKHVRTTQFEGELPHLVSGRVEHPELLLALHERKSQSSFDRAYDKILCWVPQGAVSSFPDDLVPYQVEHSINFNDTLKSTRPDQSAVMPLKAVTSEYLASTVNLWTRFHDFSLPGAGLSLRDLRICTASTRTCIDVDGDMLLSHQANQSIKHGFWERPGMVLCQTTVGFLSNFEIGSQEPANQEASRAFASNYAPIDLVARAYGRKDEEDALIYVGKIGYNYADDSANTAFNNLVRLLDGQEPLRSQVKGVLSKDLMTYMTSLRGDKGVNVMSLPVLQREYGIDNQGISLQVWASHIDLLHSTGFKFSPDTDTLYCADPGAASYTLNPSQVAFVNIGMFDMDDQQLQDTHTKAVEMGLWTSTIDKPKTLSEALTGLGRRKYNTNTVKGKLPYETNAPVLALRAYLAVAGIEACVEAAKKPGHWETLRTVFGTEVMKPYLNDAPLAARGRLFTLDMGV